MKITRVAITGGPCAGKTTVMEWMKRNYGEQILVMPEVASLLLTDNGFPKPGKDIDFSERWLNSFQSSVLPVQLNMENEYLAMSQNRMCKVVLFDRGLLDGAAYLGKGLNFFLKRFNLDETEAYDRYDMVIHLESVAVGNPDLYAKLKATNPARYESAQEAAERDHSIAQVWQGHPKWIRIKADEGIKHVIRQVCDALGNYLDTEIECKFVLPAMPTIDLGKGIPIRQGYFNTKGEMRIRQFGEQYYLTIKNNGLASRQECERTIDAWAFDLLWQDTDTRIIEKVRYFIPYGNLTLELDRYTGRHEGLITLECEFKNLSQLQEFRLPGWATGATNVTNDPAYKNRNLATQH